MAKEGWIKVHRKLQECDIWLDEEEAFDKRSAWIDLLLSAKHRDKELMFDGQMMTVTRGQLVTSVRKLASKWGWGKDKTLSYLRMLEAYGMIKKVSDSRRTLITIENYGIYQGDDADEQTPSRHQADTKQTPSRHSPATNKKEKNEKNEKNNRGMHLELEKKLLDVEQFDESVKDALRDWLDYKYERKEEYKPLGLKALLSHVHSEVDQHGSQAVADVIRLSMSQGWKGIIWDKIQKPKPSNNNFHDFGMKHQYDFDAIERELLR